MGTTAVAGAEPRRLSLEERGDIIARLVGLEAKQGWMAISQTQTTASLTKGKDHSHVLHLILTLITLGFWLLVWIPLVIFTGKKNKTISVDEFGQVTRKG